MQEFRVELKVWLKGVSERTCFIPYDGDRGGCEIAALDFIHAIEWHMKWRAELEDYLTGRRPFMPDPETASRDDVCPLGVWLNGEGKNIYGVRNEFVDLIRDHAHFHLQVGDLLAYFREHGECPPEMHQEFLQASELVLAHLARFYLDVISDKPPVPPA
jgi:hypothetical protein